MFHLFSRFRFRLVPVEDGRIDLGAEPYRVFAFANGYRCEAYMTTEGIWLFDDQPNHVWLGSLPLGTKDDAIRDAATMFYRGFDLAVEAMRDAHKGTPPKS